MKDLLFQFLFSPAILALGLVGGFGLQRLHPGSRRGWMIAAWVVLPLLLFVFLAATDRCLPPQGERCFWVGFGGVIFAMALYSGWLICTAIGWGLGRWLWRGP